MTYHVRQDLVLEVIVRLDDVRAVAHELGEPKLVACRIRTQSDFDRVVKAMALHKADDPECASTELGKKNVVAVE